MTLVNRLASILTVICCLSVFASNSHPFEAQRQHSLLIDHPIVIEKDSHLQESNVLENKVEESSTAEVGSSFDPSTDTEDSTSPSDFTTSEINTKTVRTTTNRVTTTASFTTVELLTCEFEADENNYLFPNPENCSTFYMCSNGFAYLLECPSGLVFNPATKACDFKDNVPSCNQ